MSANTRIALSVPSEKRPGRYFSFSLKQHHYNERSQYEMPSKLFAVSDIEGNFQSFYKLLLKNNVIDKHLDWKFRNGHLVIVGDCFDRGDQVIECLWLIYMLEQKALRHDGKVHFVLGNHEIMNMNGDWRYVHPKYAENTKSKKAHTALYGGNSELWRWLCTKNIMEKIGDILFIHGGVAEELMELNLSLETINNKVRLHYIKAQQAYTDALLNIVFNSNKSPFWYRGYYQNNISEEKIDKILEYFAVKTIVTGHTMMDHVSSFFNGKVINIDTDHTSNSEALLIKENQFFRIDVAGNAERIK